MRRRLPGILIMGLALAFAACASSNQPAAEEPASSGSAAQAKPPTGVPPPAGHPLARVEMGMAPAQVSELLGQPTGQQTYMTGKSWIPYYYGSDTHRTDWKYKGKGRVVFGHNRWSGNMKVIRIDYDPGEDGY